LQGKKPDGGGAAGHAKGARIVLKKPQKHESKGEEDESYEGGTIRKLFRDNASPRGGAVGVSYGGGGGCPSSMFTAAAEGTGKDYGGV